ncbi:Lateral organ boundaries, LOB [Dillenia turbinata]|uniref:Lateral organ boundaries, LOB n=1 Tax=Dillenia turbinata TaxID=194707 RepID=A0AAN8Z6L7_9MAGN
MSGLCHRQHPKQSPDQSIIALSLSLSTMESSDTTTTTTTTTPSPPPSPPIVVSPCAACKILRRRCADKCVLAPYFPPSEPLKFTIAHRVFGASNIIKFLQELPESQRADAVSSMVYEANARIRDPVYGCAGAICQLQKQVNELQAQLAKAQAELATMQCQQANVMALICMEMAQTSSRPSPDDSLDRFISTESNFQMDQPLLDETNLGSFWEPLWA